MQGWNTLIGLFHMAIKLGLYKPGQEGVKLDMAEFAERCPYRLGGEDACSGDCAVHKYCGKKGRERVS